MMIRIETTKVDPGDIVGGMKTTKANRIVNVPQGLTDDIEKNDAQQGHETLLDPDIDPLDTIETLEASHLAGRGRGRGHRKFHGDIVMTTSPMNGQSQLMEIPVLKVRIAWKHAKTTTRTTNPILWKILLVLNRLPHAGVNKHQASQHVDEGPTASIRVQLTLTLRIITIPNLTLIFRRMTRTPRRKHQNEGPLPAS